MYAVMGASGNTGSVVAGKLLSQGKKVRALGRDANRLRPLVQQGAEAVEANALHAAALTKAFNGVNAAYVMLPPDPANNDVLGYEAQAADAITTALQNAGVEYAVALSSFGADKSDKTGPVLGLHHLERKLSAIPKLNAVFLRAGYFMENTLPQVTVIKNFGMMGGPLRGDLKLPMIATRDIGTRAAELLLSLDFKDKRSHELQGYRDLSYDETATIIGQVISKPDLRYVQLPPVQLRPSLVQMGMSGNFVDLLLQMCDALNSEHMKALEPRSARNTTPTSFENFAASEFVPRFVGKTAGA